MSRFAKVAAESVFEVEQDDYDPAHCHCPDCGRDFNGSDASGGHCMSCHESFRSLGGFDKHRTGRFEPNERRCRTPDEMRARGWTVDDNHTWRMAAPKTSPWRKGDDA